MPTEEYDLKDSIQAVLNSKSLNQLNALIEKRRQAYSKTHEDLNQWIILGRFYLDDHGNVHQFTKAAVPANIFPHFPEVMSLEDYYKHLQKYKIPSSPRVRLITTQLSSNHLCPECGQGWTIDNCHEAILNNHDFRHPDCHFKFLAQRELIFFHELFSEAGYQHVTQDLIRNPYCSHEYCPPWLDVIADDLSITIGDWRKLLIIIICTDPRIDFAKLFPNHDVTKGTDYIHAWTRDKALEYLQTIREVTSSSP